MILDENGSSSYRRLRPLTFLSRASKHDVGRECERFFLPFQNGARVRVIPRTFVRPLPLNRPAVIGHHEIKGTAAKNYRDTVITRIKNRICDDARQTRVAGCQVEFFFTFYFSKYIWWKIIWKKNEIKRRRRASIDEIGNNLFA